MSRWWSPLQETANRWPFGGRQTHRAVSARGDATDRRFPRVVRSDRRPLRHDVQMASRHAVAWRDVWLGAILTAALFEVGKLLIGLYIGKQSLESTFGAAASVVVVLIWVYYTAQLVLMGAEFTNVYARRYGSLRDAAAIERQGSDAQSAEPGRGRNAGSLQAPRTCQEWDHSQRSKFALSLNHSLPCSQNAAMPCGGSTTIAPSLNSRSCFLGLWLRSAVLAHQNRAPAVGRVVAARNQA
jgi:hypothetical protein